MSIHEIRQNRERPAVGLAVISCAVLELEVEHFVKELGQPVHLVNLPQGLHSEPEKLRRELQVAIDQVEAMPHVQNIALAYGLCSRGVEGVRARRCRLAIPRAHDCITILLGDRERYSKYVQLNPGTYWYSPGWNKHHIPPGKERYEKLLQEYTEKYGAENAEYLMETEQHWFGTYNRATYVDLGVGATEADLKYTHECAQWLEWTFDRQHGDPGLLKALVAGDWDERRFLVLEPGQTIRMTADGRIIEAVAAEEATS